MFILFLCKFDQNFTSKNNLYKSLFETQPAYVSQIFPNFCLISASFSYRYVSGKKVVAIFWLMILL